LTFDGAFRQTHRWVARESSGLSRGRPGADAAPQFHNEPEDGLPRTQSATLTTAELRIMQVLWEKGSATVQAVLEALPGDKPVAYNSVLTIIRILEKKGFVRHVKDGRAHIYRAVLNEGAAKRSEVQNLLSRFFQNSRELLVLNILEEEGIDREELNRLRQLLEENR
jgi:BlaI family transcriptional regulator, penicillinase repressor